MGLYGPLPRKLSSSTPVRGQWQSSYQPRARAIEVAWSEYAYHARLDPPDGGLWSWKIAIKSSGSKAFQSSGRSTHVPRWSAFTPHCARSIPYVRSKWAFPAAVSQSNPLCCPGVFFDRLTRYVGVASLLSASKIRPVVVDRFRFLHAHPEPSESVVEDGDSELR